MSADKREKVLKRGASSLLYGPFIQTIEEQQDSPFVDSAI